MPSRSRSWIRSRSRTLMESRPLCFKHCFIRGLPQRRPLLLLLAATGLAALLCLLSSRLGNDRQVDVDARTTSEFVRRLVRSLPLPGGGGSDDSPSLAELSANALNFTYFHSLAASQMDSAMHWVDIGATGLPLLRLSAAEESADYRASRAADWLKGQSLVVIGTARNAIPGLRNTWANLQLLCAHFAQCSFVLLENDSTDDTRAYLHQLSQADRRLTLLGCGLVNSAKPCKMDVAYASGKRHRPGSRMRRTMLEEVERGVVMSALRNQLLAFVYTRLAANHSLLAVIDPDLDWAVWKPEALLQGLYYFSNRPSLDSLCSSAYYFLWGRRTAYDPCTLAFHDNGLYGRARPDWPADEAERSATVMRLAPWPVKVKSCFQGLTFYRMSSLAKRRLLYRKGHGEWICEHNTLSRQLAENYIDPNMQLWVHAGWL